MPYKKRLFIDGTASHASFFCFLIICKLRTSLNILEMSKEMENFRCQPWTAGCSLKNFTFQLLNGVPCHTRAVQCCKGKHSSTTFLFIMSTSWPQLFVSVLQHLTLVITVPRSKKCLSPSGPKRLTSSERRMRLKFFGHRRQHVLSLQAPS